MSLLHTAFKKLLTMLTLGCHVVYVFFKITHCVIIVITVFICTCFLIVFLNWYSAIRLSSRKCEIKLSSVQCSSAITHHGLRGHRELTQTSKWFITVNLMHEHYNERCAELGTIVTLFC